MSFDADLHAGGEHDDPRPPGGPAYHAGVVLLDEVEDARTRVPVPVTSSEECGAAILIIHLQDIVSQRSGALQIIIYSQESFEMKAPAVMLSPTEATMSISMGRRL